MIESALAAGTSAYYGNKRYVAVPLLFTRAARRLHADRQYKEVRDKNDYIAPSSHNDSKLRGAPFGEIRPEMSTPGSSRRGPRQAA